MSCVQTIQDYALRSIGYGERLLPREGYDLCQQAVLIGSGLIWNLYFAVLALSVGFFIATGVALAKASATPWLRKPANAFIFVFRGSPLFIQFFIAYESLVLLAWPSYTNEAIFLFHATTLVYFSGFPAFQQKGDALYYASYFADRTFNPFVAYPIAAAYFIAATLALIWLFGRVNRRLNRHLPGATSRVRYRPQLMR